MKTSEIKEMILKTNFKLMLTVTGGGTSIFPLLLQDGGGSSLLLEGFVPYSEASFKSVVPLQDNFVSESAARKLALASYIRGISLCKEKPVLGLGASASLTRGPGERAGRKHSLHVAIQTNLKTSVVSFELPKMSRFLQEQMASEMILRTLGNQFILGDCLEEFRQYITFEKLKISSTMEEELLFGDKINYESFNLPGGSYAIFPGAFNPKSAAHEEIKELASKQLGMPVVYEISVTNVDKGKIDYIEIENRVEGLKDNPVLVTNAAKYIEKARLFPGRTILAGIDSITRLFDLKYYDNKEENLLKVIEEFKELGTTFLVAPRMIDGVINTLVVDDFSRGLCFPLTEMPKNLDVSSSKIRQELLVKNNI